MGNMKDWIQSSGFRKLQTALYVWGTIIIVIAALSKLNHWRNAATFIILAMATATIILILEILEKNNK